MRVECPREFLPPYPLPVDASFLKGPTLRSFFNYLFRTFHSPGVVHFLVFWVFSRVESVSDPSQLQSGPPSLPSATTSLSISNCRGGPRWPPFSIACTACAPVELSVSSLDEGLFILCKLPPTSCYRDFDISFVRSQCTIPCTATSSLTSASSMFFYCFIVNILGLQ